MSNCYSTYSKCFFFSLDKALACLGLLNILSSCKFLAGICVRNHAKQSLQMLTSSSVWLSQCRVCALFFFHLPSQKTPTLLLSVCCCSEHMNYGSSARKDFSNQSCKKVLVWYSTVWCHCPAQPPGAPVELEVWILGCFWKA